MQSLPDYANKKWNSLSDLRDRIERDGIEKIISFDGVNIVTNRRIFGLVFGELIVKDSCNE